MVRNDIIGEGQPIESRRLWRPRPKSWDGPRGSRDRVGEREWGGNCGKNRGKVMGFVLEIGMRTGKWDEGNVGEKGGKLIKNKREINVKLI